MKIILTGSLGNIGNPLAQHLVEHGHSVTIISSKAEKRSAIEALGATAAIGSVDDGDFLSATFTGADAVYCMVPPNFGEADQIAYYRRVGNSYAQAIQRAQVKRVVHLSSYGADLDKGTGFILGSHNVEGILNALPGIALTHLRAGYFYYNLLNYIGAIKAQGAIAANFGGDDKLALVHPADIAEAAAEELMRPSAGTNVRYVVSDERTAQGVATALGAAIDRTDLQWQTLSDEQAQQGMERRGMPVALARNFVELGASLHSGALLAHYHQNRPGTLGKVKMEDFAQEFAAAYAQQ